VPSLKLSPNLSSTFSKFEMNYQIVDAVIFEAIEAAQMRSMGQKLGI
jgi:hypothetical protein